MVGSTVSLAMAVDDPPSIQKSKFAIYPGSAIEQLGSVIEQLVDARIQVALGHGCYRSRSSACGSLPTGSYRVYTSFASSIPSMM